MQRVHVRWQHRGRVEQASRQDLDQGRLGLGLCLVAVRRRQRPEPLVHLVQRPLAGQHAVNELPTQPLDLIPGRRDLAGVLRLQGRPPGRGDRDAAPRGVRHCGGSGGGGAVLVRRDVRSRVLGA